MALCELPAGLANGCANCDAVPCGYCQEGCIASNCTYESVVDKTGHTDRNGCGIVGGVWNKGMVPSKCRGVTAEPSAQPTRSPTLPGSCETCDLVPCGYCQQGCTRSECIYEDAADKPGQTSRNGCLQFYGIPNYGQEPFICRDCTPERDCTRATNAPTDPPTDAPTSSLPGSCVYAYRVMQCRVGIAKRGVKSLHVHMRVLWTRLGMQTEMGVA